jgi:hypothetical protein
MDCVLKNVLAGPNALIADIAEIKPSLIHQRKAEKATYGITIYALTPKISPFHSIFITPFDDDDRMCMPLIQLLF